MRLFWGVVAFIAIVTGTLLTLAASVPYSEGTRTGVVRKVSKRGVVCKTHEGEMVLTGGKAGGLAVMEIWDFSIRSPEVVAAVRDAEVSGLPVTVTYEQYLIQNPCLQETEYNVVGVRPHRERTP